MKVYVVLYSIGWPEDGETVAGVYSTRELADAAAANDPRSFVIESNLDSEPDFSSRN